MKKSCILTFDGQSPEIRKNITYAQRNIRLRKTPGSPDKNLHNKYDRSIYFGYGWTDTKDRTWIPTGIQKSIIDSSSKAHIRPHWDVLDNKTQVHTNIYPVINDFSSTSMKQNDSSNEHWKQWTPLPYIDDDYYLISLESSQKSLTIRLGYHDDDDYEAIFTFEMNSLISHRQIEEGSRLRLYSYLDEKYEKDFYAEKCFFIVENSRYVSSTLKQSRHTEPKDTYTHFAFLTSDDIIDVITIKYPEIKILYNPIRDSL